MKCRMQLARPFLFIAMALLGYSCVSVTSKKMNRLNIGMTKANVLDILGEPSSVQAMKDLTIFKYSDFWSCTKPMGKGCDYFVYFQNDLVEKYGAAEDFLPAQQRITNQQFETTLQANALMHFSDQMQQLNNQQRQQELAQARTSSSRTLSTNCTTRFIGNTAYTDCT